MIFITGPAWQGKTEFAESLLSRRKAAPEAASETRADGEMCGMEDIFGADLVFHFEAYVRRFGRMLEDPEALVKRLRAANSETILVAAEVGCGVVPLDPEERFWRERCGRICTEIAAQAEAVYRVICGIPMRLK